MMRHCFADTLVAGPRVLGKFELTMRVGSGAFGAVWKARDMNLGRIVAVKLLHQSLVAAEGDRERFFRETRAAAQLRHQFRLNHAEAARRSLEAAQEIISEQLPQPDRGTFYSADWSDWLHATILIRESESLFKGSDPG
jgi:hypothetical protein